MSGIYNGMAGENMCARFYPGKPDLVRLTFCA
jgi:hypothetical protein